MKKLLVVLFVLLFIPIAFAQSGSIKLLAVSEAGNNTYTGSVVDMHLQIKPGNGRVFIDSFPLTKVDTQITTRTAKQIACDYVDDHCNRYDFFYTLNSSAVIVGGPSAGAATAALTIAVLEDFEINKSVAITGTINAGNIVGTVGGIKEKINAAPAAGIELVLIPLGESFVDENNETKKYTEYEVNTTVVEVSTLDEALEHITGKKRKEPRRNYSVSPIYVNTMSQLAFNLCNRSTQIMVELLQKNYDGAKVLDNRSLELEQGFNDLSKQAEVALDEGNYYSAASYCYGSGLRSTQIRLIEDNLSFSQMETISEDIKSQMEEYELEVDLWEINTITDLESYMVVKERLYEARKNIVVFEEAVLEENKDSAIFSLAIILSRFNSAKSWSSFHGQKGLQLDIDKDSIKNSCKQKLAEAEERMQYIEFYIPGFMEGIKEDIEEALLNYNSENYVMCLFLATKAKADVESIASSIGSTDLDFLINQRLKVAKDVIAEQNAKGSFPILGYSYYEYALDLKDSNDTTSKANALIYTGYALELSKIDVYFEKNQPLFRIDASNLSYFLVFAFGLLIGLLIYDISLKVGSREKNR